MKVELNSILIPSEDIVAREIEGEIIIVPLVSGIGDLDDELFTLNDSGKAIWKLLDGTHTLSQVVDSLQQVYDASPQEIERDVLGLVSELVMRRMLVEVSET